MEWANQSSSFSPVSTRFSFFKTLAVRAGKTPRILGIHAFDGMPDNLVERLLIRQVGLAEIEFHASVRPIAFFARKRRRARIHLRQRNVVGQRGVSQEVGQV